MDSSSEPISISLADRQALASLEVAYQQASTHALSLQALEPSIIHATQYLLASEKARKCSEALALKVCSLSLPRLPIQCVAWMQSNSHSPISAKCVRLFFVISSMPQPQRLWPANFCDTQAMTQAALTNCFKIPTQDTAIILKLPSNRSCGFFIRNKDEVLKNIERIDLTQEGKRLAFEWLRQLKQDSSSQALENRSNNLLWLLNTLADNAICSFTLAEFTPFIDALDLKEQTLNEWRSNKFID